MNIKEATSSYEKWMAQQIAVVRSDLRVKHARMVKSAFSFLRGTYYRWVQLWPSVCPKIIDAPIVVSVGDLHLENFGTWRDVEGRLVWGVNDVDEACRLPYTNDLTRLAASSLLADAVLKGEPGVRERYLKMLSSGSADYPYELVKAAGVDLATPAPYKAVATRMERIMDEIEAIEARGRTPVSPR